MSTHAPHPISLDKVVFTKAFVQTVPGYEPNDTPIDLQPENNINITKIEGQQGAYAATMSSVFNRALDKSKPYYFEMECLALLYADDSLSEPEAAKGIAITAHSVLYGAIREAVAWMTARQPFGPLALGLSVLRTSAKPENTAGEKQ